MYIEVTILIFKPKKVKQYNKTFNYTSLTNHQLNIHTFDNFEHKAKRNIVLSDQSIGRTQRQLKMFTTTTSNY